VDGFAPNMVHLKGSQRWDLEPINGDQLKGVNSVESSDFAIFQ